MKENKEKLVEELKKIMDNAKIENEGIRNSIKLFFDSAPELIFAGDGEERIIENFQFSEKFYPSAMGFAFTEHGIISLMSFKTKNGIRVMNMLGLDGKFHYIRYRKFKLKNLNRVQYNIWTNIKTLDGIYKPVINILDQCNIVDSNLLHLSMDKYLDILINTCRVSKEGFELKDEDAEIINRIISQNNGIIPSFCGICFLGAKYLIPLGTKPIVIKVTTDGRMIFLHNKNKVKYSDITPETVRGSGIMLDRTFNIS